MNGPEFGQGLVIRDWWQQRNASLEAAREQVLLARECKERCFAQ